MRGMFRECRQPHIENSTLDVCGMKAELAVNVREYNTIKCGGAEAA